MKITNSARRNTRWYCEHFRDMLLKRDRIFEGRAQIRIKFHRFCRMTASYKEFISQDSQGQMEKPGALAEKWGIILIVMKGSKESPGRTLSDWEQAASGDDDYV